MPKEKKIEQLTVKQRKFVKAYAQHGEASKAVREAGYNVTSDRSAESYGYILTHNPKVKAALTEVLDELMPDLQHKKATLIQQMMDEALHNPDLKMSEKIKFLDLLAKMQGDYAPERKLTVNAKLKLPGEK